jgi:hypothetical protein
VVQDPKQVKGKKPFIGAYAMSVEAEARALAYCGWDWKTDLNDRYQRGGYGSSKDEKTGEIKWQTYHRLNEIWAKHGIEWVGEIIPSEKPGYDPGIEGTKAAAHSYAKWYSHDVWAMVVGKVVAEYKGMCKYWILADEMEYGHHEQRLPKNGRERCRSGWEGGEYGAERAGSGRETTKKPPRAPISMG